MESMLVLLSYVASMSSSLGFCDAVRRHSLTVAARCFEGEVAGPGEEAGWKPNKAFINDKCG
jgi:vancomycin resistance protein YoaR